MAYLNEFPKWDSNGRNLDWLLEQYSTFEKRIQELHQAFNDAVTNMEGQISDLESEYARQLDNFESRVLSEIHSIENAIEQVSNNVAEYVSEHMEEWQLEAMTPETGEVIIGEYNPEDVTNGGTLTNIIVNNQNMHVGGVLCSLINLSNQGTALGDNNDMWRRFNVHRKLKDFLNAEKLARLESAIGGIANIEKCTVLVNNLTDYNASLGNYIFVRGNEKDFLLIDVNHPDDIGEVSIQINRLLYNADDTIMPISSNPTVLWDMVILKNFNI